MAQQDREHALRTLILVAIDETKTLKGLSSTSLIFWEAIEDLINCKYPVCPNNDRLIKKAEQEARRLFEI